MFSEPDPEGGGYRDRHTVTFGTELPLPSPVGFVLETDVLKTYVR